MPDNFADVKIKVGGQTQDIKIEKGMVFENKGGTYCVFDDGSLKFMPKGSNVWQSASQINMTSYQWKAFQNVADNDGNARTYSKSDVLKAQEKYRQGGFVADMSNDLPQGYKIESPQMSSAQKSVEVNVSNGNESQSARLKFQIADMQAIRQASQAQQSTSTGRTSQSSGTQLAKAKNLPQKVPQDLQDSFCGYGKAIFNSSTFITDESFGLAEYLGDVNPDTGDYYAPKGYIKDLRNALKKFDGKPLTPELVSEILDVVASQKAPEAYYKDISVEAIKRGSNNFYVSLLNYVDYLKPETITKIFNKIDSLNGDERFGDSCIDAGMEPGVAKKVWNRLTPAGKEQYMEKLKNSNFYTYHINDGSYSMVSFDDYVFEKPVSQKSFQIIKGIITKANKPGNGIKYSRSASKETIDNLFSRGQITQAQKQELYNAAGIKTK